LWIPEEQHLQFLLLELVLSDLRPPSWIPKNLVGLDWALPVWNILQEQLGFRHDDRSTYIVFLSKWFKFGVVLEELSSSLRPQLSQNNPKLTSREKPKRKKKSNARIRGNNLRSEAHHYFKENPGVVKEFLIAAKHCKNVGESVEQDSQQEPSLSQQEVAVNQAAPSNDSEPKLDLDCGSDFD